MRIVVTNDDGIDSVGMHLLAQALATRLSEFEPEVIVIAPDTEYSGAGASVGALHLIRPEVHRVHTDSMPAVTQAWTVSGPPALCMMFMRLGAFGPPADLVVSGINPGANVGRAVYHSGTVGAALTARNGGISAVAISQDVAAGSYDGQGLESMLAQQVWAGAVDVTVEVVRGLLTSPAGYPVALNVNTPNCQAAAMKGWRQTEIGMVPPRTLGSAVLEPKPGHEGAFRVAMSWGEPNTIPEHLDGGAVASGYVSISDLSRITAAPTPHGVQDALNTMFG